jgi:hypothetical protein
MTVHPAGLLAVKGSPAFVEITLGWVRWLHPLTMVAFWRQLGADITRRSLAERRPAQYGPSSGTPAHRLGSPCGTACARVVARQWLFVGCPAAGLGMACWKLWRASPLAAAMNTTQATLLLGLCVGRVRYRSAPYRLLEPFAPA